MSDPGFTPFDNDAYIVTPQKDETPAPRVGTFAYIGSARTLDQFATYVNGYSFGSIPPDFVILHHTAIPSTIHARYPSGAVWDENEYGLSSDQVMAKRKVQLDNIMRYYRDSLGWTKGPHLFIDERWIWLFTPMAVVGIHAASGNSYRDNTGALHYSIGIEVIGYYEHTTWPEPIARNVSGAVAALKQRLQTFAYLDKPWAGGISAHRHYGKRGCPGAVIVPEYYMPILKGAAAVLPPPPLWKASPYGAIARTDYRGAGRAAAYFPPGEPIPLDDFHENEYRHAASGIGFIADGDLVPL